MNTSKKILTLLSFLFFITTHSQTDLNTISQSIMSYDEYTPIRHSIPHVFNISHLNQHLVYFGANHSNDPQNHQYDALRVQWKKFIAQTEGKNCIVVVEGCKRPLEINEEVAIKKGGEGSYITFLADLENIKTVCGEPGFFAFVDDLTQEFGKDEIAYAKFAQDVLCWIRKQIKPSFEEFVDDFLDEFRHATHWEGFSYTLQHLKEIHQKLFKTTFDENHKSFFYTITDPTQSYSVTNQVVKKEGILRDVHIVKAIAQLWQEGKNVFVVYGCTHAVMQEAALKKLLSNT